MPVFQFVVGRELSEYVSVTIEAEAIEQAQDIALDAARLGAIEGWETSDYPGDCFLPDGSDYDVLDN